MKSKLLLILLSLLAGAALHAQSVTTTGDVVPTLNPNPSPSWSPTGNDFFIGNTGTGTLAIAAGGTVTASDDDFVYVAIGHEAGADGTVTVSGADSLFHLTTNLYVGVEGAGHVLIEDGGSLIVSNWMSLSLGTYGGSGDVTVTGAGSELRSADIGIGNDESDTVSSLTISNGGLVNLTGGNGAVFLADNADARGVINFGAHDLATATTAGTLAAGAIYFGNGAEAVINFNQTDSLVLSANLTDGTSRSLLNQRGTGTTTLTGDNSEYTGDIKVGDGTLILASETTARDVTVSGTADAILRVTTGGTLTLDDGSFYVANEGDGTLIIEDGAQASGYAGGIGSGLYTGHAIVTGAGSQWTLDEDLLVGDGGHGTVTLADGGNLTVGGSLRLALDTDSTGTLNFGDYDGTTTAGTLTTAEITFGWNDGHSEAGDGVINFNQTDDLTLGAKLSGTGTLNQRGDGKTTLTNNASVYRGEVNVSAGELAFTNPFSLIGNGAAAVTGTGKLSTTGNLNLGLASGENTTLLIDGAGASVTNAVAAIGYAADSTGTVTVKNGATWTNTSELHLGESGSGSLTLGVNAADTATITTTNLVLGVNSSGTGTLTLNGGSLTTNYTAIGYSAGSTGTVTMTGGTLRLNYLEGGNPVVGQVRIGINGTGSLNLFGGEVIADTHFTLGYNAGGNGTLTMNGGSITAAGEVQIGEQGAGTLNLGGGTISGSTANIARNAGSTGTVTMTGGAWNSTGLFVVGNRGSGTFTQSGGTVTASEGHIGYNSGGTGTLNLLGGGAITLNGGAGTLNVARVSGTTGALNFGAHDLSGTAGTLGAATIAFGAGAGTVNFNQNNAFTLAAAITGHGTVNQRGTGTTTLTGASTYTGATNILGGTLALGAGGSLANTSAITVATGATFDVSAVAFTLGAGQILAGAGTILGDAAIAGTLAPGASPGPLTFADDLTLLSTATLLFEIGGASRGVTYDAIDVGGDLAYAGAFTFSLIDGFTPASGDTFQLFNVTGGHSGAFDSVAFAGSGWTGSFDYATGTLTVSAIPEPSTYAMLAGAAALLLAALRRRARRAAVRL